MRLEDGSDFNEDVIEDGCSHQQAHVADSEGCSHGGRVPRRFTQTYGFQEAAEGINPTPVFVHVLPQPGVEFLPGVVKDRLARLQTLAPSAPVEEVGGLLQQHHHTPLHARTEVQPQFFFSAGQERPEGLPESPWPRQRDSAAVFCRQAHRQLRLSAGGGRNKLQQTP